MYIKDNFMPKLQYIHWKSAIYIGNKITQEFHVLSRVYISFKVFL